MEGIAWSDEKWKSDPHTVHANSTFFHQCTSQENDRDTAMLLWLHFDCFSILIVSFGHTIVWFLLFIGSFKQAKIPSLLALKILILHFSSQNAPLCLKKWLHFDIVAIEHTLVVSFFNPAALIISWRVLILSQKISALWHHLGLSHMASMSCNKIILLFSAAPGAGNYTCGEMT